MLNPQVSSQRPGLPLKPIDLLPSLKIAGNLALCRCPDEREGIVFLSPS